MSIRKKAFVSGEFYHIYNRGNSKQKIFLDKEDYDYFIKCLFCCNTYKNFVFREDIVKQGINAFDFDRGETIVSISAWVLMANHFHIYITTSHKSDLWRKVEKNRISEFMRKVSTAYAKYFNAKYQRTGSLFEGKFKSVHIENDNQAKYLFSYIHLNPIKLIDSKWKEEGIKDIKKSLVFLDSYKWSSYSDYLEIIRQESKIINKIDFLNYFDTKDSFQEEIFEWIKFKSNED